MDNRPKFAGLACLFLVFAFPPFDISALLHGHSPGAVAMHMNLDKLILSHKQNEVNRSVCIQVNNMKVHDVKTKRKT